MNIPFFSKKQRQTDTEYERGCAYCEYAAVKEQQGSIMVFCRKRQRKVTPTAACSFFSYDLLKRKPRRMNMPTIDPEARDL